jgi:hypothetical protein
MRILSFPILLILSICCFAPLAQSGHFESISSLGWVPEAKRTEFPSAGGIIIQTGEDEFIIAGTGIVVTFATDDKVNSIVGILQADEVNILMERGFRAGV